MRISSYAVARPAYYDRNATNTWNAYVAGTVAPHGGTTRWTVTIASGKKAIIETANVLMWRDAASTVIGASFGLLRLTSGATLGDIANAVLYTTTVYVTATQLVSGGITLYASDVLSAITQDNSTGGSIYYNLIAKGTIFDA